MLDPKSALLCVQDRWLECDLEKNHFLDGFVGFGGGQVSVSGKVCSQYWK